MPGSKAGQGGVGVDDGVPRDEPVVNLAQGHRVTHPPLEGAPRREAPSLTQEKLAHLPDLWIGSSNTASSSPTLCSLLTIMITSAFKKSFSE